MLKQLAVETGGQAFNNTNNLKPAFERVDSDLHNYYMLGYTPVNTAFDGKFRTIQVKVKRSGLTIAARKGYFAVRNPGTSAVNGVGSARAWRTRTEARWRVAVRRGARFVSRTRPAGAGARSLK